GSVTGWEWNFGDANATPDNPNISLFQNPTHHFNQPGDYYVQLISISDAGCRDTLNQTESVNGAGIVPKFTLENNTALCSDQTITLKDASTIDAGRILRVEIFWDQNDLTQKTVDNDPTAGETYTFNYPEFGTPATRT